MRKKRVDSRRVLCAVRACLLRIALCPCSAESQRHRIPGRPPLFPFIMAKPAVPIPPEKNDGGIVVALVLLIAALCAVYFSAIVLYASATDVVLSREKKEKVVPARRLARLLAGWANVGNAVVHALLVIMLVTECVIEDCTVAPSLQPARALTSARGVPTAPHATKFTSPTRLKCPSARSFWAS